MSHELLIQDYPMDCCGMVLASGFSFEFNSEEDRFPLEEDYAPIFKAIEDHQKKHMRNCAIITLSSRQYLARKAAEMYGYKEIFSFFNPNSRNNVGIFAKTLVKDVQDYAVKLDNKELELVSFNATRWQEELNVSHKIGYKVTFENLM